MGVAVLTLYGIVTAIGGCVALFKGCVLGLSRVQAGIFTFFGMAVIALGLNSLRSHHDVWLVIVCLASLLCRVWNGQTMGQIHITHILLFGSVMGLGVALTYV